MISQLCLSLTLALTSQLQELSEDLTNTQLLAQTSSTYQQLQINGCPLDSQDIEIMGVLKQLHEKALR